MKKAIFIVGPTASGKTSLALEIAAKLPSVLISADSAQVFKDTDIVTGKDLPTGSQAFFKKDSLVDYYLINNRIKIFLLDQASPFENFSVNEFVEKTRSAVKIAKGENKVPILVGGTRFFINALLNKIDTLSIPPDKNLREKLAKLSVEDLQKKLLQIDKKKFNSFNNSDVNNPRRLIRAIEVAGKEKKSSPVFEAEHILTIGLFAPFEFIKKKIDVRISKRLEDGALGEAERLFQRYNKLSEQVKALNGFNQLFEYFNGKRTLDEAIEEWKISEYQLARDQIKWVENLKNTAVFDVTKKGFEQEIMKLINHELSL